MLAHCFLPHDITRLRGTQIPVAVGLYLGYGRWSSKNERATVKKLPQIFSAFSLRRGWDVPRAAREGRPRPGDGIHHQFRHPHDAVQENGTRQSRWFRTADGFAVLTGSLTMPQKRPLASRNELMVFCHCAFSSVSLQRTPVLAPATSRLGPFFGRLRKSVEILSRDLHGVLSVSVPSSISI